MFSFSRDPGVRCLERKRIDNANDIQACVVCRLCLAVATGDRRKAMFGVRLPGVAFSTELVVVVLWIINDRFLNTLV